MGNYHTKHDIGDAVFVIVHRNHICNCNDCTCSPEGQEVASVAIGYIAIRAGGVHYYVSGPGVSGEYHERSLYETVFQAKAEIASKLKESNDA